MARPQKQLPDNEIAWRGRQGQGRDAIHQALVRRGIEVDERTVGRRLEALRAKGWPGADAYAATLPRKKKPGASVVPPAPATDKPPAHAPSSPSVEPPELTEEELVRLPAELLAKAYRAAAEAFGRALDNGEAVNADKYASVMERFSRRLVEVRPPEKVEPVKDPTNVAARREILARWDRLREPYEVSAPVVEAIEAHAAQLRERMETAAQR